MAREKEKGNIIAICSECSSERKEEWQRANANTQINKGDFVKLAFEEGKEVEHMWVHVTKTNDIIMKDNFVGVLDNDPVLVTFVDFGDEVSFDRHQIEDLIRA